MFKLWAKEEKLSKEVKKGQEETRRNFLEVKDSFPPLLAA